MSAEAPAEHQDGLAAPTSPSQKRKRSDESASPNTRRVKRDNSPSTVAPHPIESAETSFMESNGPDEHPLPSTTDYASIPTTSAPDHAEAAAAAAATAAAANAALASSTAAAALGSMFPHLNVPQTTEETFASQQLGDDQQHQAVQQSHHHHDVSYGADLSQQSQADGLSMSVDGMDVGNGLAKRPLSGIQLKPAVGTDEWHKMRKDNHKEVERRRRETINEGINELAKIVPGCEKNKGSILQRAVVFITQLKENETQNIEKWTLEKLLTEQAIAELSASNDKLKSEVERVYAELEAWKRVAQDAGLQLPDSSKNDSSS